jgi:hypothetical protein
MAGVILEHDKDKCRVFNNVIKNLHQKGFNLPLVTKDTLNFRKTDFSCKKNFHLKIIRLQLSIMYMACV